VTLFYFHVHNAKGAGHADGDDHEIVIVCEKHRAAVEADPLAEFVTETTDAEIGEHCDQCIDVEKLNTIIAGMRNPA